jgi:hypothetical protein
MAVAVQSVPLKSLQPVLRPALRRCCETKAVGMAGGAAAGVAPLLRVEGGGDGAVGMAGGDAAGASAGVAPLLRAEGGGDGAVGMAGEAAAIPSDR